ncbi:hypothetical protein BDR26DRAFT_869500 [Obelidium mucronatum]|nr:hypothetical protein BDR26DRAFT_869500 [Obelidium mucronatum]
MLKQFASLTERIKSSGPLSMSKTTKTIPFSQVDLECMDQLHIKLQNAPTFGLRADQQQATLSDHNQEKLRNLSDLKAMMVEAIVKYGLTPSEAYTKVCHDLDRYSPLRILVANFQCKAVSVAAEVNTGVPAAHFQELHDLVPDESDDIIMEVLEIEGPRPKGHGNSAAQKGWWTVPSVLKKHKENPGVRDFMKSKHPTAIFPVLSSHLKWHGQVNRPKDKSHSGYYSMTQPDSVILLVDASGKMRGGICCEDVTRASWVTDAVTETAKKVHAQAILTALSVRRAIAQKDGDVNLTAGEARGRLNALKTSPVTDEAVPVQVFLRNGYQTDLLEASITESQCLEFYLGLELTRPLSFARNILGHDSLESQLGFFLEGNEWTSKAVSHATRHQMHQAVYSFVHKIQQSILSK